MGTELAGGIKIAGEPQTSHSKKQKKQEHKVTHVNRYLDGDRHRWIYVGAVRVNTGVELSPDRLNYPPRQHDAPPSRSTNQPGDTADRRWISYAVDIRPSPM